jgi:hypothetical protein
MRRVIPSFALSALLVATLVGCEDGTTPSAIPVYEASTADGGSVFNPDAVATNSDAASDGQTDATVDATLDAARDATADAGLDATADSTPASDSGTDAAADAVSDAEVDASADANSDAPVTDASDASDAG